MKTQILNVEAKVRKSTVKFAQSLLDAGLRVKRVCIGYDAQSSKNDMIEIKGMKRFSARLYLKYDTGHMMVTLSTTRGPQVTVYIGSYNELNALFKVWNISKVAA